MSYHDRSLHRQHRQVSATQSAHPTPHYQAIVALTARYLPACRNEIREMRAAGKQPCLPHQDETVARTWARLYAAAALRHGVREDIAPALDTAA